MYIYETLIWVFGLECSVRLLLKSIMSSMFPSVIPGLTAWHQLVIQKLVSSRSNRWNPPLTGLVGTFYKLDIPVGVFSQLLMKSNPIINPLINDFYIKFKFVANTNEVIA